jgi:hypothetical protein
MKTLELSIGIPTSTKEIKDEVRFILDNDTVIDIQNCGDHITIRGHERIVIEPQAANTIYVK